MDRRHFLTLSLTALAAAGCASRPQATASSEIGAAFAAAGIDGTMVVLEPSGGRARVWSGERTTTRFVPASTFKMLNALIALETGSVSGPGEVFRWDGGPRWFKSWERDMTFAEAMGKSCVPVYQEVARRIGLERMAAYVKRAGFGNADVGTVVDRFWLDGPLAISAMEQAEFASRLAAGSLPFRPDVQAEVRAMLLLATEGGARLFGKTGWAADVRPMVGWLTGWVERDGAVWAFSLNLDMAGPQDAPKRKAVAVDALKRLGVWPA